MFFLVYFCAIMYVREHSKYIIVNYNVVEDSKPASFGVRIYLIYSHDKGKQKTKAERVTISRAARRCGWPATTPPAAWAPPQCRRGAW
jgi:hypothetical protein